jgi:hypothetical protein
MLKGWLWIALALFAATGMWWFDIGKKPTRKDRDGGKHKLTFAIFVAAMILLIGTLTASRANASVCRGPVVERHESGGGQIWIRLTASRWCGTSSGSGSRFLQTGPGWDRDYGESVLWDFNKWFDTTRAHGFGVAPDGDRNVEYEARWVAGEFVMNVPPFAHSYPIGARIWTWANGNYTLRETSVEPSGMPRPQMA